MTEHIIEVYASACQDRAEEDGMSVEFVNAVGHIVNCLADTRPMEALIDCLTDETIAEELYIDEDYTDADNKLQLLLQQLQTYDSTKAIIAIYEFSGWLEGQKANPHYADYTFAGMSTARPAKVFTQLSFNKPIRVSKSPPLTRLVSKAKTNTATSSPALPITNDGDIEDLPKDDTFDNVPVDMDRSIPDEDMPDVEEDNVKGDTTLVNESKVIKRRASEGDDIISELISIAATISSLRSIDLDNIQYRFRSPEAMVNSQLYQDLLAASIKEQRRYLAVALPMFEGFDPELYDMIISKVLEGIAEEEPRLVISAMMEYEGVLRAALLLNNQHVIVRALSIGNKFSRLLDPPPKERTLTPKSKYLWEAILHEEGEIRPIEKLLDNAHRARSRNKRARDVFVAYLVERTKHIAKHLDNMSRTLQVEYHNQAIYKKSILIDAERGYNRLKDYMYISQKRHDYLVEHYNALQEWNERDLYTVPKEIGQQRRDLAKQQSIKREKELHAYEQGKKDPRILNALAAYYNNTLCPMVTSLTKLYDAKSADLTDLIDETLEELAISVHMPQLIKEVKEYKRVKYMPDPKAIQIKQHQQRYVVTKKAVPNYRQASTREERTIATKTKHMSAADIVADVSAKLVNLSNSSKTSGPEVSKLAGMLKEALNKL